MFYYRITTTTRRRDGHGQSEIRRQVDHREFLSAAHLGEHIAGLAAKRPHSINIKPVSQAIYVRETRPGA